MRPYAPHAKTMTRGFSGKRKLMACTSSGAREEWAGKFELVRGCVHACYDSASTLCATWELVVDNWLAGGQAHFGQEV